MTRIFDSQQSPLWVRSELVRIDLLHLITYSDRAAETVDTHFYFARQPVLFDWENNGTDVEFWPVIQELGPLSTSINHLPRPEDAALLRKPWSFTLTNETYGDDRLINVLRDGHILENARIEWTQLALSERPTTVRIDLTALAGDEHTFFYRGRVRRVGPISNESITFQCEMEIPTIDWLHPTDATKTDPDHVGVRVAKVAGESNKVACINWDVGFVSTLAAADDGTGSSLELTDATGFGSTGKATVGGEVVTWTGKSSNTLTGVTRAVDASRACNHAAGDLVVEVIDGATFLIADHQVDAINDVYALSPYTSEIVRLTTSFTKNVADTTTISGRTVASLTFTATELRDALRELAASPEVTDDGTEPADPDNLQYGLVETLAGDPGFSTQEKYELPAVCDGAGLSGTADAYFDLEEDEYFYFRFYRPLYGFERQKIQVNLGRQAVSGTATLKVYKGRIGVDTTLLLDSQTIASGTNIYTINTTEDAEWISVEVTSTGTVTARIYEVWQYIDNVITTTHQQATNGKIEGQSEVSSGNWFDENDTTYEEISGSSEDWIAVKFSDPGSYHTQRIRYLVSTDVGDDKTHRMYRGPDYNTFTSVWTLTDWYEPTQEDTKAEYTIETEEDDLYIGYFKQVGTTTVDVYEISRDYVSYSAPPPPEIAIAGASVGFGLRLFADVDGYEVPSGASPAYKAGAAGTLMKKPCDILRYLIEELGGDTIDTTTYDSCYTNLGGASGVEVACDLRTMGTTLEQILARLGFESRVTLVPEETASGRVWKMLTALSTYAYPAATAPAITEWEKGGFVEIGRALEDELATRFLFLYAPDWTRGDGQEAYTLVVIANEDDNDLTVPSTTDFQNAVDDFGSIDAEDFAFRALHDVTSAKEIAGYYAHELIRGGPLFALVGVPWWEAYNVEVGDIKNVTPPWAASAVKSRVIEYVKDPRTEQIELRLVEVE